MNKKQFLLYLFALIATASLWPMDKQMVLRSETSSFNSKGEKDSPIFNGITPNTDVFKGIKPNTQKKAPAPLPSTKKEEPKNKEIGTVTFLSNTDSTDFPYIVQGLYKDTDFTAYASKQFAFNQAQTITSMNEAYARGAKVSLEVGPHGCNKMNNFDVTAVRRSTEMHAKITTALDSSPSKKTPTKGSFLLSSANDTNNGWKNDLTKPNVRYNCEAGILVKNNIKLAEQAYEMAKSTSPMKPIDKRNVILVTPEKVTLYNSKHTRLNESWAKRLYNLADDNSDNRSAYLRTMNINNRDIVDASIKAKNSGATVEWQVHNTALTKHGEPLLTELSNAGIPVHVFNPGNSRAIQHVKDMLIKNGEEKQTYFNSNANFTKEGDSEVNFAICIPNNKKVALDAEKDFERNKIRCVPLAKALELKKDKQEKDKAKKELTKKRELENSGAKEPETKKPKKKK